jgi:beta-phosphoglucomutase
MKISACIFDLDGVIVDTATYHYLAWKRLADELGISFTEEDNEQLKGISRKRSLEILLEIGNKRVPEKDKDELCKRKNQWYLEYILQLKPSAILPGVVDFLSELKERKIKLALGSASKNATLILDKLEISDLFEAVVDGHKIIKAKPDPQIFLKAAEELNVPSPHCVVFEDAVAGIEAAINGNMYCIGVGNSEILHKADFVIKSFMGMTYNKMIDNLKS